MVRTKAILVALAALLAASSIGIWILNFEQREDRQLAQEFFGTSRKFPTTGGQKMRPEW